MECRTCCQKQQNKIRPASRKSKREFFRRENTKCTFLFGTNRPKSPVYVQQPQRPPRQSPNAFFCSFGFQDAKTRGAYFFSIQSHRFRLGRPISPAANPITTSNKTTHSLPAPAGQHLQPPFFSYPSHHFFNIYKAPSFHQVLLPTILPHIFLFLFSISPSSSRLSPFRTSNSNLIPLLSLRPPLPSCCRFKPAGQTRNVVSRAGAACKAADGAGEEPAFLFFLYVSFFCFSLFSLLFHLPGAAASPRRLHFSFCFCFSFCLFFLFFFFLFFLLAFFAFSFYLFFF